jgi:hypothetical protein
MVDRFDFTGRLAEQLRAERAVELAECRGKIGMVNGDIVIEEEGIWDPFSGHRLSPAEEAELEAQSRKHRA